MPVQSTANGTASAHGESTGRDPRGSVNSGTTLVETNTHPRTRPPRSLPPWISSYEDRKGRLSEDADNDFVIPPPQAKPPQHNSTPSEPQSSSSNRRTSRDGYIDWSTEPVSGDDELKNKGKKSRFKKNGHARGRKWDHLRTAEPVIITGPSHESRWKDFMQSTRHEPSRGEESRVVPSSFLDQLQPDFNQPFEMPKPSKKPKPRMTPAKFWKVMVQHPMVPLVFRLIVLITSILALSLAAKLFEFEDAHNAPSSEKAQSVVAIVVDCLAIPYIGYMTWDEYTGRPLGLKSASQKASLVLMDLLFIIFKAASTALAFESLVYGIDHEMLGYRRSLASFMLVGLTAWSISFTVNVFRLVYKLDITEDEDGSWLMKSAESGLA